MSKSEVTSQDAIQVVSFFLNDQIFGIDIKHIQDILCPLELTKIPLAEPHIEGVSNLRGRIVTAINLKKLILKEEENVAKYMNIVIDDNGELYSLLVERVDEVVSIDKSLMEEMPMTINPAWRDVAYGVYQMKDRIMILLDDKKIINSEQ